MQSLFQESKLSPKKNLAESLQKPTENEAFTKSAGKKNLAITLFRVENPYFFVFILRGKLAIQAGKEKRFIRTFRGFYPLFQPVNAIIDIGFVLLQKSGNSGGREA